MGAREPHHPLDFLTNPERFMVFSRWAAPMFGAVAIVLAVAGLVLTFAAPEDYQQGDTVRMMFIHVPAAVISMFVYLCLGIASLLSLVFRHALADAAAVACAPLGAAFT
ncbi:MAG: cytochrome c biogenesis protein CcsA, partial [Gemmatimonadaceae bacterium]|nr:cytochrome c biogenesis protein CcsA [Caulobacter sp.]